MKIKISLIILISLIIFSLSPLALAATAESPSENFRLEQIQGQLPNLNIWFYGPADIDAATVSLSINNQPLTLEQLVAADSEPKVHYYFLVDCSGSISQSQMAAIKAALLSFNAAKASNQLITIIAFGDEVIPLVSDETDSALIDAAINGLNPNQDNTVLFDTLATTTDLALAESMAQDRKLAFVFTDSVDYNLGGYTQQEVEQGLLNANLPLYAFGFEHGEKNSLDNLGALSRLSGGIINVVNSDNLEQIFAEQVQAISSQVYRAKFVAANNILPDNPAQLSLQIGEQNLSRQLYLHYWQPDNQAPQIDNVNQIDSANLQITFSEAVEGANLKENYSLLTADGLVGIEAVAYDADNYQATLTIAPLYGMQDITVSAADLSDISMEKNGVSNTYSLSFNGLEGANPSDGDGGDGAGTASGTAAGSSGDSNQIPGTAWLFIILVLIIIIIIVIIMLNKKRKAEAAIIENEQIMAAKEAAAINLAAQGGDKVHFVQENLKNIALEVADINGQNKRVEIAINKTLFVGRSDICDIVFDNPQMSRQHFVIAEEDDLFTISNLSSTSATYLNGIAINNQRPLNSGDIIEAAGQKMIFRA